MNLYDLRYTDIQYGLVTAVGLPGFASLGSAKMQGIDFSLSVTPVEGFTLGVSGDVNRSRYTSVNPAVAAAVNPAIVRRGGRIINNPPYTLRFDGGYTTPITDTLSFYSNASAALSDSRIANQFGDETVKTTMVDANIGIRTDRYELEVFGTNLTDERGPWFIRQNTPPLVGGPVPRTIGLRARFHYR